jgi:uncharacterized membrane protein YcfT
LFRTISGKFDLIASLHVEDEIMTMANLDTNAGATRIDWVDTAKGICIILVVMMHTTLGLEAASGQQGWMHAVVEFSRPFRMPDFFVISGLFLAATIDRPWRHYIDRKVIHFFYFYILWVIIQFAFKAPFMVLDGNSTGAVVRSFLFTFVQPFGTLWFIYMLPVFFVVAKLFKNQKWLLLAIAAVLQIAPVNTHGIFAPVAQTLGIVATEGHFVLVDEFASYLVYFVGGYVFAPYIFKLADYVRNNKAKGMLIVAVWFVINLIFVLTGWLDLPIVALALGGAGALAIVAFATLIAQKAKLLTHLGANSIVIYLAFFLPMVVSRLVMLKIVPWMDAGTMALICLMFSVAVPMIGYWIIHKIGFGMFLFHRPNWAILSGTPWKKSNPKAALAPAE